MPAVMATTVDYQRTTVELLQRIAREELPGLIEADDDAGYFIPRHVERTIERFPGCGDPRGYISRPPLGRVGRRASLSLPPQREGMVSHHTTSRQVGRSYRAPPGRAGSAHPH